MRPEQFIELAESKLVFEKHYRYVARSVSPAVFSQMHWRACRHYMDDQIGVMLRAVIPAEHMDEVVMIFTVEHPTTWWDALKLRLRQRYPRLCNRLKVKTMIAQQAGKADIRQIYPKFPNVWPELGDGIRVVEAHASSIVHTPTPVVATELVGQENTE